MRQRHRDFQYKTLNAEIDDESTLRTLRRCRAALETVWPAWRTIDGGLPPLSPGQALSDKCCIHAAFILSHELSRVNPERVWRTVGGWADREPAVESRQGGYHTDTQGWVQHLWVLGQDRRHGGTVIADITADQFGGPPEFLHAGAHPRYRMNMRPADIRRMAVIEAPMVDLVAPLLIELQRYPEFR